MWLMPSYGRPEVLRRLLDAPGGWPEHVFVLVNRDDPKAVLYEKAHDDLIDAYLSGRISEPPWHLHYVPAGSRFASAVRDAFNHVPDAPFYGIIDDDYWPVTLGWHDKMVAAAGDTHIAIANNKVNFPSLYTCRVMGGELARSIGTISPGKMAHNYSDDTWAQFAKDFDLLVPLEDVIVEHRHHLFRADVKIDETYRRGSGDFDHDQKLFEEWLNSDERRGQCDRVAELLGVSITTTDLSGRHLVICVPIQDAEVDVAFWLSMHNTSALLARNGVMCSIISAAGGSHIGKARERALWRALREPTIPATDILFIDSDMGWDADQVIKLLCTGHDFCAAVGVKKQDELAFCFNPIDPPTFHPVTGFMDTFHIGFAFVMLKPSVIEKLCKAYPDLEYDTGTAPREWALFFDIMWNSGRTRLPERLSEDYSFCHRWVSIGGKIWTDPDCALIHAGRKEYTGRPRDMLTLVPIEEAPQ